MHYYLFTYEDTRDTFSIPYDISILEAVYRVPSLNPSETAEELAARPLYNKKNEFWEAKSVGELIESLEDGEEKEALLKKVVEVKKLYNGLSETYQSSKGDKGIPLA